jgi:hypothetical protein
MHCGQFAQIAETSQFKPVSLMVDEAFPDTKE